MEFFNQKYFGNTLLNYIIFLAVLAVCAVLIHIFGRLIVKTVTARCEKTNAPYGETVVAAVKRYLLPVAYFTAFTLCTKILALGGGLKTAVGTVSTLFAITLGAVFLSSMAAFFFERLRRGRDESGALAVKWLGTMAKMVIWLVALILFLDNVGVKITSLVTGLGIGGVAIAFAAQSALSDLFCFFTIFFDKPYEVGDFIIAGEQMGTVEHIGVKTTRLRALSGEQLVCSNSDLTGSRISNYKSLQQRRVVFTLAVTYDTPVETLRIIPGVIKEIVEGEQDTQFGRAHFASYGAYSLNFEIVYFVLHSDYDKYMDINQQINLKIKEAFERIGARFAFPTQSLVFEGGVPAVQERR
ncbi:MAG: mechanosensitive ion channel domain-containing protein [Clostridiaceae bacterium]